MSTSKSFKDSDKGLNVPKFDHGSTDGKGEKWRKWLTLLSSAFDQSYPMFAMQLNDVPEPIDSPDGSKLWNLYWHPMSLRMLGADESYEKLVVEFTPRTDQRTVYDGFLLHGTKVFGPRSKASRSPLLQTTFQIFPPAFQNVPPALRLKHCLQ
jgi:hypothetical protein